MRRRGIVLPVALALLFVMLTLALSLADLGQVTAGITQRMEREALEAEWVESRHGGLLGSLSPGTEGPLVDPHGWRVPPGYWLQVVRADSGTEYAMMDASCFPYGIVVEGDPASGYGNLSVNGDVRSSSTRAGLDADESGVPVALWAWGSHLGMGPRIFGSLNGRIHSTAAPTLGATSEGGVYVPISSHRALLSNFRASLAAARANLGTGLTDLGPLLAPFLTFTGIYATPVDAAFVVPAGRCARVPTHFNVQGDLVLEEGAVLFVNGLLRVRGRIYLARHATLHATLDVEAETGLDIYSSVPGSPVITSTISSGRDIWIPYAHPMYGPGDRCISSTPTMATVYTRPLSDPLRPFLRALASRTVTYPEDLPGVLLAADQSLRVGNIRNDPYFAKASGLFYGGGVSVLASRTVGAALATRYVSLIGQYRWYPYFTRALVHTPTGEMEVSPGPLPHRTAFGRVGP